jgi:hypothetical protein
VSTKNIRKDVGWGEKYKKYKREKWLLKLKKNK